MELKEIAFVKGICKSRHARDILKVRKTNNQKPYSLITCENAI
jgi:hypothetical protein